ncbi:Actin-2 [Mucor velutinosus]|uniref:Actin-2 n=1 Tax=Mucor velutinosus TaxID=708070 RepID=A0AAN7DRZ7_9FUNG|nr:Actin-2 [Mucor velutinosus]
MSYCQEATTTNYYYNTDMQDKQKIQYILDGTHSDTKIPQIVNNNSTSTTSSSTTVNSNNFQFIHYKDPQAQQQSQPSRLLTSSYQDMQPDTPPLEDARPPPTATELQYIKRIHTLMNLVAKQTKEIQSLRSIIEAYSQNENNDCCSINSRKRNKQF